MATAIYKQYEVGTGTTGQGWHHQTWNPRHDAAWPTVHDIGINPDACKLVDYEGQGQWIDTQTMPAQVKCEFDSTAYNNIVGNISDTRRFVHKYEHQPDADVLKRHCGAMISENGKTIPRYLSSNDTFCKSALVGENYATFVDDICNQHHTAEYCACVARNANAAYLSDKGSTDDTVAACWYKPCVFNTGFKDPTTTSACTTNVCPLIKPGSAVSICN